MNIKFKIGVITLVAILGISATIPSVTALATEIEQDNQTSLYDIEEDNNTTYDTKTEEVAAVQLTDNDLIINGEVYNQEKLEALLETAQEVEQPSNGGRQKRFAAAAGVYLIPGIGQVALAATGAIVLGGITIGAGHWAYNTIKNWLNNPQNSASRAYGIPKGLLDSNGNVKLGNFNQKVKGKNAWKDPMLKKKIPQDMAEESGK